MNYNIGDTVKIKSIDWYNKNKDWQGNVSTDVTDCYGMDVVFSKSMTIYCGSILVIENIYPNGEIGMKNIGFSFTNEMIECKY